MDTSSTPRAEVVQVPPLEPPASLTARLQPPVRSGWSAGWRASPSLLSSLVIHLAILIVLGSLTLPQMPRRWFGELVACWSLAEDSTDDETEVAATLMTVEADRAQSQRSDDETLVVITPDAEPANPADVVQLAAAEGPPSNPQGQVVRDLQRGADVEAPRFANAAHDDVVSRFIEFDIGRLRGKAGERARRDFEALGPEAIPALVRGLNRAARIQASCPVLVIASKLETSLGRNADPSLLEYALANIGRDVPEDAFHVDRVRALRQRWLGIRQQRIDALRQRLGRHGVAITIPMQQRYEAMCGADSKTLAKMLGAGPASLRMATVAAVIDQPGRQSPAEDAVLARGLIPLLEDKDAAVAGLAEEALLKLADGERSPALESEDKTAAWTRHWDQWEAMQKILSQPAGELADSLDAPDAATRLAACTLMERHIKEWSDGEMLILARSLAGRLDDADPAVRRRVDRTMRALAKEAGGEGPAASYAASHWQAYWDRFQRDQLIEPRAGSFLSMARLLEERGQVEVARKRYRQVVAEFPGTAAAREARQRLQRSGSD